MKVEIHADEDRVRPSQSSRQPGNRSDLARLMVREGLVKRPKERGTRKRVEVMCDEEE